MKDILKSQMFPFQIGSPNLSARSTVLSLSQQTAIVSCGGISICVPRSLNNERYFEITNVSLSDRKSQSLCTLDSLKLVAANCNSLMRRDQYLRSPFPK